jgi:predicted RNase H-like nuclease (RuvC/YqgF family)
MTLNFHPVPGIDQEASIIQQLRNDLHRMERENSDLRRQVSELRAAVEALLAPPTDVNIR